MQLRGLLCPGGLSKAAKGAVGAARGLMPATKAGACRMQLRPLCRLLRPDAKALSKATKHGTYAGCY